MARVILSRHVAADPASVALLLAAPTSPQDGVSVSPPRRTGIGFTAGVELADTPVPLAIGDITVEPDSDTGSVLRLVLGAEAGSAPKRIERAGAAFLSSLALRARSRSYAA